MVDNVTLPGTGTDVAADDIGGVLYQRAKLVWGPDGTANDADVASGKPLPIQIRTSGGTELVDAGRIIVKGEQRFISAAFSTLTRPANTTAYAANDAVSNNATAGSVTALSATVSDVNDDPIALARIRIKSTDTGPGTAAIAFRIWLFNSDPTASSGVGGGDNAAWSQKQAGFVGTMKGTFRAASDGSVAVCVPDELPYIICKPVSGAKTLYALVQTLGAFTPSANSTTFDLQVEAFQGRA